MPANRVLVCEGSAMSQDNTISVLALRAEDYSPDGKYIVLSLVTKYSAAERKYAVPVECFHDLIVDIRRLNAAASSPQIEPTIQPAVVTDPADDQNRLTVAA